MYFRMYGFDGAMLYCIFGEPCVSELHMQGLLLSLINDSLLWQTLIERHREYTLIYNAECDSLNPKSGKSIC